MKLPRDIDGQEAGLTAIILAIENPCRELLDQLDDLADQHGLKIYRWKVGLTAGAGVM